MKRILLIMLSLVGFVLASCEMGNDENGGNLDYDVPDSPLNEVECASNEILYTTTSGKVFDFIKNFGHDHGAFDLDGFGGGYFDSISTEEYGIDEKGIGKIIFENDIEAIPSGAFYKWGNLEYIKLPTTVTSIGLEAFGKCTRLKGIVIPINVTELSNGSFSECSNLSAFYGKFASVDNRCLIKDGALKAFAPAGLTEYTIPNNVTIIQNYIFRGCSNLTSITIPEGVTLIGDSAFYGCSNLASVTIPESVTYIGDKAFFGCSNLTSITIPKGVTSISNCAFYGCSCLTNIIIPEGVTSIGDDAFALCNSLTSIRIPDSVTLIGIEAFAACKNLTNVYCKPATPPSGGDHMFYNHTSELKIYVPTASVEAYKAAQYWSDYADYIEGYDF